MKPAQTKRPRAERGLALVCALLLMAAAMVIGVAVARGAFALLASARNEGDRVTARLAAEAALLDAEREIAAADGGSAAGARAAQFEGAGSGFVAGCGHGATDLGLCSETTPPAWQSVDLAAADAEVRVPYGRYTGAILPIGAGTLPARLAGYLIEKLQPADVLPAQGTLYRITAIGFGTRTSTQVVLQSLYRVPASNAPPGGAGEASGPGGGNGSDDGSGNGSGADGGGAAEGGGTGGDEGPGHDVPDDGGTSGDSSGGNDGGTDGGTSGGAGPGTGAGPPTAPSPTPLPAGRIGWRDIANWPELHARATQ